MKESIGAIVFTTIGTVIFIFSSLANSFSKLSGSIIVVYGFIGGFLMIIGGFVLLIKAQEYNPKLQEKKENE